MASPKWPAQTAGQLSTGFQQVVARGIDLKTAAQIVLIPAQSGRLFLPRAAFVYVATLTGVLAVAPILRIGNNGTFTNVAPVVTLTAAIALQIFAIPLVAGASLLSIDIGTVAISVDVQTPATATTMTGDVYLEGIVF